MNKKICAITGSTPNEYSFGYDEENMNCALEKRLIVQAIFALVSVGVTGFLSTMNEGAELWGSEARRAHHHDLQPRHHPRLRPDLRRTSLKVAPRHERQILRSPRKLPRDRRHPETPRPRRGQFGADRELFGEDIYAYDADKYIADTADMLLVCGDKPGVHAEILMREFEGRGKKIMRMSAKEKTIK